MKKYFLILMLIIGLLSCQSNHHNEEGDTNDDDLSPLDDDQNEDDDTYSDDDNDVVSDDDNDADDDATPPDDDDNDDNDNDVVHGDWIITVLDRDISTGTAIIKTVDGRRVYIFYGRGTDSGSHYIVKYKDEDEIWVDLEITHSYGVYDDKMEMDENETFYIPMITSDYRSLYLLSGNTSGWEEELVYTEIGNYITDPSVKKKGDVLGLSYLREMNDWYELIYVEKQGDDWVVTDTGIGDEHLVEPILSYGTDDRIFISYGSYHQGTMEYDNLQYNSAYFKNDLWNEAVIQYFVSYGNEGFYQIRSEADEKNRIVLSYYDSWNFYLVGYYAEMNDMGNVEKTRLTITPDNDLIYGDIEGSVNNLSHFGLGSSFG